MMIQLKNRFGDINKDKRFLVGIDRSKARIFDSSNKLVIPQKNESIKNIENKFSSKFDYKNTNKLDF